MALQTLDIPWTSSLNESFDEPFIIQIEEGNFSQAINFLDFAKSSLRPNDNIPKPPPPPIIKNHSNTKQRFSNLCYVPKETKEMWDRLFKEGCGADVHVIADDGSVISAHQNVLSVASPILGDFLQQSEAKNDIRCIKISGVPHGAVYAFIRFLYSSCYEEEEVEKYILHLLVLSHSYVVPSLKRFCEQFMEKSWLTKENVIDVLQLARMCDTPRLAMICMRLVFKDFRSISSTEGWKVMKRADPLLEQELLESLVESDSRKQDRVKKIEEKRVYLQLHEAMEALLHICRDGCRTIGPRDKVLKGNQVSCNFPACKGLEMLIRHFSGCKTRVPGGCIHCKRMWQLLELHSRMCSEPDSCKIPLCRHFKGKMQRQSKKEAAKWKLLVSRVIAAKNTQKLLAGRKLGFDGLEMEIMCHVC